MSNFGILSLAGLLVAAYGILISYLYLLKSEKAAVLEEQLELTIKGVELHKKAWKGAQEGYEKRLEAYHDEVDALKKYILNGGSGGDVDLTRILSKKKYPSHD